METRTLGKNGPKVSRMGLGLAALGRPGYINLGHGDDLGRNYALDKMEAQAHAMMDAAYGAGVRYFDVARSYGKGEAFLGSWLHANPTAALEITVGSKWGYAYTADWSVHAEKHEVKEHSLAQLNRQWPESQALLGAHLDLYQIHSATPESGVLENTEVIDGLARLRSEVGILIGLSVSGAQQAEVIERALQIERDGELLFGSVQATFNVLEPSVGPVLQAAHDAGLGVIVKEGLANGRLTDRNANLNFAEKLRVLLAEAANLEASVDALALAWVLSHPFVDTVLSGPVQTAHLHSNLAAASLTLSDSAKQTLAVLEETPSAYWTCRANLSWN